FVPFNSPNI
nr:Chain C, VP60-10 [Rabbit hemorrhagic disease virus]